MQGQCREQARQAETVIAMQMADEYMVESGKLKSLTPHLQLCAFAAVHHKQPVTVIDHLRCRLMPERGRRRSAAEYVYFKFSHRHACGILYKSNALRSGMEAI